MYLRLCPEAFKVAYDEPLAWSNQLAVSLHGYHPRAKSTKDYARDITNMKKGFYIIQVKLK